MTTASESDRDVAAQAGRSRIAGTAAQAGAAPIGSGGLLVVLGRSSGASRLVRSGGRIAAGKDVPWFVVSFQSPSGGGEAASEETEALQLARRLGAETVLLPGVEAVAEITDFARRNDISELLVARPRRGFLDRLLRRDFVRELLEEAGELELHIVPDDARAASSGQAPFHTGVTGGRWLDAYLGSTVAVFLAAGVAKILDNFIFVANLTLIILAAVLYSATAFGLGPAIYASLLGVAIYNYFFIPPLLSFSFTTPEDVLTTVVFVAVSILVSNLAGRLHDQAAAARSRERRTDALFRLSRKMAAAAKSEDVLRAIVEQVDEVLSVQSVVLLPRGAPPVLAPIHPEGAAMSDADLEAALWASQYDDRAGRGTSVFGAASRLYQPLRTSQRAVGILGLRADQDDALRDPEFLRLLEALSGLAAVAIERIRLAEEIGRTQVLAESEGLRAALLSSISHDLRTPLSSIIGSSSSLLSYGHHFDEETRRDLLQTIYEEADRLNQFVGNLLEMTKLESGALTLNRQWAHVDDLIGTTLDGMRVRLSAYRLVTDIEPRLPMLHVDFVLMERVLTNLLENAAKYSNPGGTIKVSARLEESGEAVAIQVVDEGIGLSAGDLHRIFDKFFRARERDRRIAGTGLGLSICKGIVEAHHGELIAASAGEGKGSCFSLRLPATADQPMIHLDEAEVA